MDARRNVEAMRMKDALFNGIRLLCPPVAQTTQRWIALMTGCDDSFRERVGGPGTKLKDVATQLNSCSISLCV